MKIWLLRAGLALLCVACCFGAEVPITALAFSPDGAVLVSNGARRIDLRSPQDGNLLRSFPCDMPKIAALAFHPSGKWLAVAGGTPAAGGEVRLFDWENGKEVWRLTDYEDVCLGLDWNNDGTLLGVAGTKGVAQVWRVAADEWTVAWNLKGHTGPVTAIRFSPSGRTVVTASADRSLKVWSLEEGSLLRTLSYHTEAVHALVFRTGQEGRNPICASSGADGTVRIWQPEIGRMVRIIRGHGGSVFALAYAPDGKSLFSAGQEGIIRELDAESDAILREWKRHKDWVYALVMRPDGKRLASGDWSGKVLVDTSGE